MLYFSDAFDRLDRRIVSEMRRWGHPLLRWSLGIVFIWFGLLKPFGVSAATELFERTVYWLPPDFFIPLLGWWEVAIGVCLLFRPLTRVALLLLFLQMPGTFLPLILLPEVAFERFPFVPTLEGQYIIKNLVLISAGLVIGGTVRRPEPAPGAARAT
ncbi:MAG: DoxX family protein, partial [Chloroflexota bacterium]|nr:DoxX family protein [Chloroflexota bacterium]